MSGDDLLVNKLAYWFHPPARGDIVVFQRDDAERNYVKRIVGLPGETLAISHGQVLINGTALNEPYAQGPLLGEQLPRTLGRGEYFVLGDNRLMSKDSRVLGPVLIREIRGQVWLVVWPLSRSGLMATGSPQ